MNTVETSTGLSSITRLRLILGVGIIGSCAAAAFFLFANSNRSTQITKQPEKITCAPYQQEFVTSTADSDLTLPSFAQLQQLRDSYLQLGSSATSPAGKQLRQVLEERKKRIIALADTKTDELATAILTPLQKQYFAQQTSNCIETTTTVSGNLREVILDDFDQHIERDLFLLRTPEQEFSVVSNTTYLRSLNNQAIEVTGERFDDIILVSPTSAQGTTATGKVLGVRTSIKIDEPPAQPPETSSLAPNVLVVPLNFANTNVVLPTTTAIKATTAQAEKFFDENSYHQVGLRTVVRAAVKVSMDDPCPSNNSGNLGLVAQQAIDQIGTDTTFDYTKLERVYVLAPFGTNCTWGGRGEMGTYSLLIPPAKTVTFSVYLAATNLSKGPASAFVMSHELGHTYGLYHSPYFKCQDEVTLPISAVERCPRWAYSNPYSTMGGFNSETSTLGHLGHFSAAQKVQLGWIPGFQTQTINPGASPITVLLTPQEWEGPGIKMVKIRRGQNSHMTLEFRQPTLSNGTPSLDSTYAVTADGEGKDHRGVFQGALVHVLDFIDATLIDATPLPINSNTVPIIPIGQTFYDQSTCPTLDPVVGCTAITVGNPINGLLPVTISIGSIDMTAPVVTFTEPVNRNVSGLTHFSATITDPLVSNGFDPNTAEVRLIKMCGVTRTETILPWHTGGDYDFGTPETCVGTATLIVSLYDRVGNYGSMVMSLSVNALPVTSAVLIPSAASTVTRDVTISGTWSGGVPCEGGGAGVCPKPIIEITAIQVAPTNSYALGQAVVTNTTWSFTWTTYNALLSTRLYPDGLYDLQIKTTAPTGGATYTTVNNIRLQN